MSDIENRISWVFEADGSELTSELERVQEALDGLGVSPIEDLDFAGQGATKSMGNLTDKVVTATIGIAQGVAAAGVFAAALIVTTQAVAAQSKELEKMGLLSAKTGRSLRETSLAIDATKASLMATSGIVADFFGPAIKGLSRSLSVAAMALGDLLSGEKIKSFEEYAIAVFKSERVLDSFGAKVKKVKSGLGDLNTALAQNLRSIGLELREFQMGQTEGGSPFDPRDLALATERDRLDEMEIFTKLRIELLELEGATALEIAKLTKDADLDVWEQKLSIWELEQDIAAEREDEAQKAMKVQRDLVNLAFQETVAIAGSLLDITKSSAGENIAVQKGVALGEVALATAVGLANAFKDVNPITTPIKVAAVLANSAASVAAILATNEKGGPTGGGGASLDFGRAGASGGGSGRPAGDLGGGGTFVVLGNEVFDAQTRRALRRDSELDRAIRRRGNAQGRLGFVGDS